MTNRNLPLLIAVAATAAAALLWLDTRLPDVLPTVMDMFDPMLSVLLVAMIALSAVLRRQFRDHTTYRHLGLLMLLATIIFASVNLTYEPERHEVSVPLSESGHLVVEAKVDGVPVVFLVDTGANKVVLRPRDAACIGFDHEELRYDQAQRTAAGTIHGAPVTLDRIAIGDIDMRNVEATVNGKAMDISLLGMSFLNRLSGFTVVDGKLILRD